MWQRALLYKFYYWGEQNLVLECTLDVLHHLLHLGIDLGLKAVELNLNGHHIVVVDGLEGDEVVATQTRILHENLLDLHGEYVYTLDDEHIVGTALDTVDTTVGTSALTWLGDDAGEVARTVTQDRHHGAVECGKYHLAHLAIGHWLEGVGIYNLNDIVVLPQVHTFLILTLEGYTRTVHLGHTKRVVGLYAQHTLDAAALLLGVGLGSNAKGAQFGAGRIDALFLEYLGQTDGIGQVVPKSLMNLI